MLIKNLKRVEQPQPHWQFGLEVPCGTSSVLVGGWRFYEDSGKVVAPRRRSAEGAWRASSWMREGAAEQIAQSVKRVLDEQAGGFDQATVAAALKGLEDARAQGKLDETLTALEGLDGLLPAIVLWVWRTYHV